MSSKSVPFDYPGFKRPRSLRFDYNAIADAEAELKMTPAQLFQERAGFHTLRGLLWAGLRHEERGLSTQGVGRMIEDNITNHGGSLEQLFTVVADAVKASGLFRTGDDDEDAGAEDPVGNE